MDKEKREKEKREKERACSSDLVSCLFHIYTSSSCRLCLNASLCASLAAVMDMSANLLSITLAGKLPKFVLAGKLTK